MKREALQHLRNTILDSMSFVIAYAPDDFPEDSHTSLDRERTELMTRLNEHSACLRSEEQLTWHRLAEREIEIALAAFAAGDRKRGSSVLQQAEEHFRRSFRPKKIRPGFVVGTDGQAIKT